jgi:penicillin amidase/acyl-homoserine-lactone acylase
LYQALYHSTPFQTTTGSENPRPEGYSSTLGIEKDMNNRALRALELLGSDDSITEEEFHTYKYDMAYSSQGDMPRYVQMILDAPLPGDPGVQAALDVVRNWDLRAGPKSIGTALVIWTLQSLDSPKPDEIEPAALADALVETVRTFKEAHGRADVPWAAVNRLQRADLDLDLGGGPDILHAVVGRMLDSGRLQGREGDSYVLMVTWDQDGQVRSRSIHQYGSATLDGTSPHYADQAPLFVNRQLKPVWLDEDDIRAHLEGAYRPGEEIEP